MLRNSKINAQEDMTYFLNEVLSLNAQESDGIGLHLASSHRILNEVLSLNAQESKPWYRWRGGVAFLNEVLSLNAQE